MNVKLAAIIPVIGFAVLECCIFGGVGLARTEASGLFAAAVERPEEHVPSECAVGRARLRSAGKTEAVFRGGPRCPRPAELGVAGTWQASP